jgi:hypothetical protein
MRHPRRQRRRSVAPLLARLAEGVGLARERYARGRVGRERRTWPPSRASVSNGSSVHESGSGPAAGSVRPAEVGPARRAAALAALRAAPRAGAAGGGLDIGRAGCLRRLSARPGRLPRSRPPEDGLDPLTACGSQTALVRRQGHPHALALGARNRIRARPATTLTSAFAGTLPLWLRSRSSPRSPSPSTASCARYPPSSSGGPPCAE